VEFISFWYQSFGSKISFVCLLFFILFPVPYYINKKRTKTKKQKKRKKKKVQNSSKNKNKNKKIVAFNLVSARK
jgi:uncharacterized membrane protein